MFYKNKPPKVCTVQIRLLYLHTKNVNFFIVKVLVKSNKGGCEVTLIYFYTAYITYLFHYSIILLTFGVQK